MSAPLMSTLNLADHQLALYHWPTTHTPTRATVLMVHGLSEHGARYTQVAAQLNAWGFDVYAYDQYGHGLSSGTRGRLPPQHQFVDDLVSVLDHTRSRMAAGSRLILLGHSMGGLVATSAVARGLCTVDGLVLSSPAYAVQTKGWQKALLKVMPRLLHGLCLDNGINPLWIARDPAWVQSYATDPLVHREISAELGLWFIGEGAHCIEAAKHWNTPTLLLYAGQDFIVKPEGCAAFAALAPRQWLEVHAFEAMYHEIFNDPDRAEVFAKLGEWLDRQSPATTTG